MNGTAGQIESVDAPIPAPAPKKTAATTSAQTAETTGNTSSERSDLTTAQLSLVSAHPRPMRPIRGQTYRTRRAPDASGALVVLRSVSEVRYLLARSWV